LIYEVGHCIEPLIDLGSIFEWTTDPAFEKPLSESCGAALRHEIEE
jgi:hypothetical protein